MSGKVKVIWLIDGKSHARVFNSHEEAKPLTEELNAKGVLWVLTDKVKEREGTGVYIERLKKYLSENGHDELLSKINNGDFDDPAPTLAEGDKVRHKDQPHLGTGVVRSIAKSGVRAYVDFGDIPDWNKKRLLWKPSPAYYLMTKLEKV